MQDKGLDEAFWPLYEMDEPPKTKTYAHWLLRALFALAACLALWGLHSYAPDKGGFAACSWSSGLLVAPPKCFMTCASIWHCLGLELGRFHMAILPIVQAI